MSVIVSWNSHLPDIGLRHGLATHTRMLRTRAPRMTIGKNLLLWAMIAFALVGLSVSTYLTYLSLSPPTSCPIGDFSIFSCNAVIYSQYSHFYGVSVALLGLGWFVIVAGLILVAWQHERFMWAVLIWSLLGAAGVASFVYTEVFLLGSICPLCTIAHAMGLAILVSAVVHVRAPSIATWTG
jgi:uncharacterized membrane protein